MSRLGELGLSSYEETVYRSLLSMGVGTASAISDESGVPTGRIYDVLNGLEARDLVGTRPTDPTTYVAVDPETAVDRLLAERARELEERAERYERLAEEVGSRLAATSPTESRFWTASLGSEEAVSLAGAVYEDATSTVRSAMSRPYEGVDWERFAAEIDASLDTSCSPEIHVLLTPGVLVGVPRETATEYARTNEDVDVRVTTDLTVTFDLLDGQRVCFHVPHPLDRRERLGVIDLYDEDLADWLDALFAEAWAEANSLEDALDGAAQPVRNE